MIVLGCFSSYVVGYAEVKSLVGSDAVMMEKWVMPSTNA